MSSIPPPYELTEGPGLDVSGQVATIPSNDDTQDASAVKDNKQVDAVSANKKTDANASKGDTTMIKQTRDVKICGIINYLQNNGGDSNTYCFFIFPTIIIFIIVTYIYLCFYPFSRPYPAQNNGGNTTHALQRLEHFVSNGAINGSKMQDTKRGVYPGTREKVLSKIKHWIDNPNPDENILWLHGPTGVGKSAIVQAITDSYTTEKVAANFFFFHSDSDRNDGYRLFPTLAKQFISSIPGIEDHIAHSLMEQHDLTTKNLEIQFQELIVRPLEALSGHAHQPHLSDKIVIIDGIDECVSTDHQERILKVIGNVATNPRVPLRFIISSRAENHINKTITSFQRHTLSIDLSEPSERADAYHDIEKYFIGNFVTIAKDQGIDPATWPGMKKMQDLVSRASGQFQYASTVIKFISEEGYLAQTQLDVILGSKPHNATSPFGELDSLYIRILERQSDKEFVKTFLSLLVAQNSINPDYFADEYWFIQSHFDSCFYYRNLRRGYGILMELSEQELRIKLSRMKSLLDITPNYVYHHHMSFLEFLQDPFRSGQYHIGRENATRRYLVLAIDSVIRSTNESLRTSEHPDFYPPVPEIVSKFRSYSSKFDDMSREDWQEALQRLEKVQDRLLNLPNFTIPRNECTIFHLVHHLQLNISYHQPFLSKPKEDHGAILSLAQLRNLHANFSTYFQMLKMITKEMFYLMNTLRHVNPEMIAMRVRSWSETQNLRDLVYHIVNGKHFVTKLFSADVARKVTQLGVELYIKAPVLPQSLLTTTFAVDPLSELKNSTGCYCYLTSRVWVISNFLDHGYILPVLETKHWPVFGFDEIYRTGTITLNGIRLISDDIGIPIRRWRTSTNPSSNEILSAMLKLARAIQYLHSMGIMPSNNIGLDDIYVDSRFRVRISPTELVWPMYGHFLQQSPVSGIVASGGYENSMKKFGEFFCTIYFDTNLSCTTGTDTAETYQPESGVDVRVWQLIERCLSGEGKPSINEVVKEMESWKGYASFYH